MEASASNLAGFTGMVLLLLPALVTALHCGSIQHSQRMLNSQMLQMLRQKGPNIPLECLPQVTGFNFPATELNVTEPRLARKATHEILSGLLRLFGSNLVQMGWETTAQERLLSALHAQMDHIKRCLEEEKTQPRSPDERLNKLELLNYFQEITTFLQNNSRSPCAEIVLRLEARKCLQNVDMLVNMTG